MMLQSSVKLSAIGELILSAISKKGWTIDIVAQKTGRHRYEISKWVTNTPNFKLRKIVEIELLLDINIINKDIIEVVTKR